MTVAYVQQAFVSQIARVFDYIRLNLIERRAIGSGQITRYGGDAGTAIHLVEHRLTDLIQHQNPFRPQQSIRFPHAVIVSADTGGRVGMASGVIAAPRPVATRRAGCGPA